MPWAGSRETRLAAGAVPPGSGLLGPGDGQVARGDQAVAGPRTRTICCHLRNCPHPGAEMHTFPPVCIVMRMMKAAIAGASGYAGGEIVRLLLSHPVSYTHLRAHETVLD